MKRKSCRDHDKDIHECIEMILYGLKNKTQPVKRGNIRLDCNKISEILQKTGTITECNCSPDYYVRGPIFTAYLNAVGSPIIECYRCNSFLNDKIKEAVNNLGEYLKYYRKFRPLG